MLVRWRHLRFLPTPAAVCLLDWCLTLLGQPDAYWRGDSTAVNELSPEMHRLLSWSVLASVAGLAALLAGVAALLVLLPRAAALFVAFAVTICHTVGATTWLWLWPAGGHNACIGLCLLSALALAASVCWEEAGRPAPDGSPDRWGRVRWLFVALLAAARLGAYLWSY